MTGEEHLRYHQIATAIRAAGGLSVNNADPTLVKIALAYIRADYEVDIDEQSADIAVQEGRRRAIDPTLVPVRDALAALLPDAPKGLTHWERVTYFRRLT